MFRSLPLALAFTLALAVPANAQKITPAEYRAAVAEYNKLLENGELSAADTKAKALLDRFSTDYPHLIDSIADIESDLGSIRRRAGRLDEAVAIYLRAVDHKKAALADLAKQATQPGKDQELFVYRDRLARFGLARLYRRLAECDRIASKYRESADHLQAARRGLRELDGRDLPGSDVALTATHRDFIDNGKRRELPWIEHTDGMLAEELGQYDEARKRFDVAHQLWSDLGDRDNRAVALHRLGVVAGNREDNRDYRKAVDLLTDALKLYDPARKIERAESLIARAVNQAVLHQFDAAQKDLAEGHDILVHQLKVPRHPAVYAARMNRVALLRARSQGDDAERASREGRELVAELSEPSHPLSRDPALGVARIHLALAEAKCDRWPEAIAQMGESRKLLREHVFAAVAAQPEQDQCNFLAAKEASWLHAGLSLALHAPPKHADAVSAACVEWLMNSKTIALETNAERIRLTRDTDSKAKAVKELARELRDVRSQLGTFSTGDRKDTSPLADLVKREQELKRRLLLALPAHVDAGWTELATVRKSLNKSSVLVELARVNRIGLDSCDLNPDPGVNGQVYLAWLVREAGPVVPVTLGSGRGRRADRLTDDVVREDGIDRLVEKLQARISAHFTEYPKIADPKKKEQWLASEKRNLRAVSDRLVSPLRKVVGDRDRWFISPDKSLWGVSWAALLDDKGEYLVKSHTISAVSSGRDLLSRGAVSASGPAVLVGGVSYGEGKRFSPLDQTRLQVEAIQPLVFKYTEKAPTVRMAENATEKFLQDLRPKSPDQPRLLVLCTHGYFTKRELASELPDPLMRCGIAFADANKARPSPKAEDDGILTGAETLGLDLTGTELVYLSACETAVGDPEDVEGWRNLQYAFRLAGARAVVATLWQVPTTEQGILNRHFFDQLNDPKIADDNKAVALRRAQLKYLRQMEEDEDDNRLQPVYWAGALLTGR